MARQNNKELVAELTKLIDTVMDEAAHLSDAATRQLLVQAVIMFIVTRDGEVYNAGIETGKKLANKKGGQ